MYQAPFFFVLMNMAVKMSINQGVNSTEQPVQFSTTTSKLFTTLIEPDVSAPTPSLQDIGSTLSPKRLHSVCYHTNWAQYRDPPVTFTADNIDPFLCTHIVYAFAKIDVNYTLAGYEWNDESTPWSIGNFEKFTNLKQQNPELKCLLSIGGATHPAEVFTDMVATSKSRGLFIKNAIRFVRQRNFDGVDIDWEFPVISGSPPENKNRFTLLLQELSAALDDEARATGQPRLILSVAVSAGEEIIRNSYDTPQVARAVDFINLLSYNFHGGAWEDVTGHHAALYASEEDGFNNARLIVDYIVGVWIQAGCPPHKLNLGIGTFGTTFSLSGARNGIGAPANGPAPAGRYTKQEGILSYYEICDRLDRNFTRKFDAERKVPYAYNEKEWIGYDDELSVLYKVDYIRSRGLGGAMVWAMDMDDFKGEFCGTQPWPILSTIRAALNGTIQLPSTINVMTDTVVKNTVDITVKTETIGSATNETLTQPVGSPSSLLSQLGFILVMTIIPLLTVALLVLGVLWRRRKLSRITASRDEELNQITNDDQLYHKMDVPSADPREYPRNRIVLKEQLGCGAFGAVFKAEAIGLLDKDIVTVAVKKLKEPASEYARIDFLKELTLYRTMDSHPNIISMIGYCTQDEPLYLILEYAPNGNLKSHLDRVRTGKMNTNDATVGDPVTEPPSPREIMQFAYEIASGMEYLSSKDCIHRDLAARNILLGEAMVCKLSDFGLARDMAGEQEYEMKSRGRVPIRWMAPESILHNIYSSQSDVWSYAVLLWEIVTLGSHPYPGLTSKGVIEEVKQGNKLPRPSHCSSEMYSLMQRCWKEDPQFRPTFQDIRKELGQMLEEAEGYLDMSDFNEQDYAYLRQDEIDGNHSQSDTSDSITDDDLKGGKDEDDGKHISPRHAGCIAMSEDDDDQIDERYVAQPTL